MVDSEHWRYTGQEYGWRGREWLKARVRVNINRLSERNCWMCEWVSSCRWEQQKVCMQLLLSGSDSQNMSTSAVLLATSTTFSAMHV